MKSVEKDIDNETNTELDVDGGSGYRMVNLEDENILYEVENKVLNQMNDVEVQEALDKCRDEVSTVKGDDVKLSDGEIEVKTKKVDRELNNKSEDRNIKIKSVEEDIDNETNTELDVDSGAGYEMVNIEDESFLYEDEKKLLYGIDDIELLEA